MLENCWRKWDLLFPFISLYCHKSGGGFPLNADWALKVSPSKGFVVL